MKYLSLLALGLLLAACGAMERTTGIPDPFGVRHPFQGDGDQKIVQEVLGERSVYVPPVEGLTAEADAALRQGIVTNAEALDILVSAAERPAGAMVLAGKARDASTVDFALYEGERAVTQFTASGDPVTLAAMAARSLAVSLGRLGNAPPTAVAAAPAAAVATPAAYVRQITAPSPKQAEPLKRAITAQLAAMGVRMSDGPTDETYAITATLGLSGDQAGQTGISIVWRVYAPDGKDLGKAEQQNTLPTAAIRNAWAEQATLAGGAAASSVAQIIASHFNVAK